jgi:peptidoglycan/LPS O-acetylase OafA/YrhL
MSTSSSSPGDTLASSPPKARRFYVPQLDGLRFLAFLLVFVHHGPRLSALLSPRSVGHGALVFLEGFGWCGVDLFLVLSAYLITSLLLIEHERHGSISLRGFYLRRILRIWPLYYFMTCIGFFLLPMFAFFADPFGSPQHVQLVKHHLLAYCTLFGNFSSGVYGYPTVVTLAHLWTVTLEEQFYIVWPLSMTLLLRTDRRGIAIVLPALLVGTVMLRMHLIGLAPHPFIWTNTLARLDPLLIGIAIAFWRQHHPARPGWAVPILKLVAGAAAVWSISLAPNIETQSRNIGWQFLATAVGFGLILDATHSLGGNPFSWLLSRRPLVWLGKLTYGLYVYHVLSLQVGGKLVDHLQRWGVRQDAAASLLLKSAVSLGLTIAVSALSYRFFESFFLRLKERFARVGSRPVDERSVRV